MRLNKMFFSKAVNYFPVYLIISALSVLSLFIAFDNNFPAYGAQEKSLFFGHQFDISKNNGTSELSQIAVDGNHVYVVWQDNTPGNYDIFFTHSSDNGNSFTPVRNLSNNNGTSELPQIAVDGNHVYVVWQDNTPGNYDILFRRSANNGEGFKSVNLKNTNGTSQFPQIATLSNQVYVVWQDNTPGNYEIFLQRALSNGTKYNYRDLSNNNGTSIQPQLALSSNNMYVIWKDNDSGIPKIFFKHMQKENTTGKIEYGSTYRLNHTGEPSQAKLITGSEHFYGVWTIYLNNRSASTLEFYPFTLLGDNPGVSIPLTRLSLNESISNPDVASRNGDTFLVWENAEVGNKDVFFKKFSTDFFERND